jgi:DNA-binding CsgD family transcriptional regulator
MVTPKNQFRVTVDPQTYPLGENSEHFDGPALALLALSHTSTEHRLYLAMLSVNGRETQLFTTRRLMALAQIHSLSTVRRGLEGLVAKLSVDLEARTNGNGARESRKSYRVYQPEQVISRRRKHGLTSAGAEQRGPHDSFARAIVKIVRNPSLSRREAQVALCCAEGLTNAEIGQRLDVSEQTVKFHLRHVFLKFGVKRRGELISRLLT